MTLTNLVKDTYKKLLYSGISDDDVQRILDIIIERGMYIPHMDEVKLKFMCYSLDACADKRIISRYDANACKYKIMEFIKEFDVGYRKNLSIISVLRQEIADDNGCDYWDHRISSYDLYPLCENVFTDWKNRFIVISNIVKSFKIE